MPKAEFDGETYKDDRLFVANPREIIATRARS
jgi:hypothetical protein